VSYKTKPDYYLEPRNQRLNINQQGLGYRFRCWNVGFQLKTGYKPFGL